MHSNRHFRLTAVPSEVLQATPSNTPTSQILHVIGHLPILSYLGFLGVLPSRFLRIVTRSGHRTGCSERSWSPAGSHSHPAFKARPAGAKRPKIALSADAFVCYSVTITQGPCSGTTECNTIRHRPWGGNSFTSCGCSRPLCRLGEVSFAVCESVESYGSGNFSENRRVRGTSPSRSAEILLHRVRET